MSSLNHSIKGAVLVDYRSNPIALPPTFLTTPPATKPTYQSINFGQHDLPEFKTCPAFTIDNVLSSDECKELIRLAESSVYREDESESPWRPAMVAFGAGWEVSMKDYRNSDRIIWDRQEVADRILARCLLAAGVSEIISTKEDFNKGNGHWKLHSLNERLRFLKYTEGQFFKRKGAQTALKRHLPLY